ncbi:MAG: glycosyltransferase family 2 protein [Candidatus Omnitrophica bacterium]|nr:glycosyltransferase family 2 protein [Candidatus Omnitrophota bacterium]
MLNGKKVVVVMPAYNAEKTLRKTVDEIPRDIVDDMLVTDDHSNDRTAEVARSLGLKLFIHDKNLGYGANQKTCYREALKLGADVVVMLHPDYQYPPKLITPMAGLITSGMFDAVLGSRILGGLAMNGGMPVYKYISNRCLTLAENMLTGQKLSEYHTGYRAFSREVLLSIPLLENSDDFVFDNQMLLQVLHFGYRIGEITAPSVYTEESSSINFSRSVVYGFGVLKTALQYMSQKYGLAKFPIFDRNGRKLAV